jgi:hypothetical protein
MFSAALRGWQAESERASGANLAFDPEPAAVKLDELARERETESRSFRSSCARPRGLLEFVEDPRLILRRDANASVAHRDPDLATAGRGGQVDLPSSGRELYRVGEQIEDDLLDLALVAIHHPDRRIDHERQANTVTGCPVAHHCQAVLQHLGQPEVAQVQLHSSGLDLGQIENVIDQ